MRILLALPLLLLAACQATSFENAPLVAAAGCDPALVGGWTSVGDTPQENGEVVLHLDAACQLRFEEHERDGVRRTDATPLHLGRRGEYAYAWVDSSWALKSVEEDHRPPAGDIQLARYHVDGDTLQLWSTDDKAIAHAIIDGELTGTVSYSDSELFNRLTGEPAPAVLDRPGLFDAEPAKFQRLPGG